MRARPDAGLRSEIRSRLGRIGQWDSIETGATEGGVPDLHCTIRDWGREVWIECKATAANAVKFRPGQVGWLFTHWRYGGVSFVFTRRATRWKRGRNLDQLYVTEARRVRELSSEGLDAVPHLYVGDGGPGGWDWVTVEEVLRGAPLTRILEPEPAPDRPVARRASTLQLVTGLRARRR